MNKYTIKFNALQSIKKDIEDKIIENKNNNKIILMDNLKLAAINDIINNYEKY